MTNVDAILLVLMAGFFIWGMFKGLLWSVIRIASYIAAFLVISAWSNTLRDFLVKLLGISSLVATVIAYILLFLFMMLIGLLIYMLLMKIIKGLKLSTLNRMTGGILWVLSYFLILAFIVVLIDVSPLMLNNRNHQVELHTAPDYNALLNLAAASIDSSGIELSSPDLSNLQEALEEARKDFKSSKSEEENIQHYNSLVNKLNSYMQKEQYEELMSKMNEAAEKPQESVQLVEKNLQIKSLVLQVIIEPLADFLEEEILKIT